MISHPDEPAILVASHEPLMSSMVAYLLGCSTLQVDMKKAALVRIDIDRFKHLHEARDRGGRPPDVLALRLIEAGAEHVTIYSNTVTVEAPAERWAELESKATFLIEHLFEYYGDDAGWSYEARGVEAPPPIDPPD